MSISMDYSQSTSGFSAIPIWGDNGSHVFQLAGQLVQEAENYVQQLSSANIFAPTINPAFPTVTTPPKPNTTSMPVLSKVAWTVPAQPADFTTPAPTVAGILPGPFTGKAPTLNFPAAPAAFAGLAPASPPIDLNFTYPTVDLRLPTVPALLTLDTVQFPNVDVPDFDLTIPALTAVAPNVFRYVEGALYTSELLDTLKDDLKRAMTDGTWTGLPTAVEQNLWNKGREREYRAQADALAELERMETMGFAFPPGVYLDARIKIQTETQNTVAGLSRDVMIKQAELILTNITDARKTAVTLESQLITYANQVAQRAFDTAKYAAEAAVAIYNAQVQAYGVALRGYEVQATIFDTKIKALLARVEIAKAQISYEQAKATINTAIVEQYKAEVQASEAVLEIYKTQVQIVQTRAEVEKIKIQVYGEQIRGFVGQINAYTAQVEAYKAQAETQGVIENVFKTQVDAYSAQVQAGAATVNALIAAYRGQIEAYTAKLEGYKAAIQGMVGQAQAASQYNTAEAEVYKAEIEGLTSYNQVLTAQWQAVLNEQEKIAEVGVQAAKMNGDLYIAARGLSLDASKVGAQVVAQLGAAALGAIHWANNSSWSAGISSSFGQSSSRSESTSTVDENIKSV